MDELPHIDDYANWMGNLPVNVTSVPINEIAMPGSHDSFSYSISQDLPVAPDDDNLSFINKLPSCFERLAKWIVYRWSYTQQIDCTQQLQAGIRYFDLRVAPLPDSVSVYLVHGLYGISAGDALKEINEFLLKHPKEIVLLDFQHFYEFKEDTHTNMIAEINNIFGDKLCPFTDNLSELTLRKLWDRAQQVFVFYRNLACYGDAKLWPGSSIPNPWPETTDVNNMLAFLERNFQAGRPANKFYVTQGILTPDTGYVAKRWFLTLRTTLVGIANSAILTWLSNKYSGQKGVNVVITDFVDSFDYVVVKRVVALNFSLSHGDVKA